MQRLTINVNPNYRVVALYHRDDSTGKERILDWSDLTDDELDNIMEYAYSIQMLRDVNTGGEMEEIIDSMKEWQEEDDDDE